MSLSISLAAYILSIVFAVLGFCGICSRTPTIIFQVCFFTMLATFLVSLLAAVMGPRRRSSL